MAGEDERKKEWWHQKRWWIPGVLLGPLALLGLLALVVVVPPRLIRMPQPDTTGLPAGDRAKIQAQFQTDRTKAENDLRGTLVTTLAGVAVAGATIVAALNLANSRAGLMETQRQNRDSSELQRRGQVTERFGKAIEQLGARGEQEPEKLDIRLGGIYALEQIARDSPELHWPIVEILTAFTREHTKVNVRAQPTTQRPERDDESTAGHKVATDIQAALTVLARRNSDNDRGKVDLGEAKLRGAYLTGANLQGANFAVADLQEARLDGANLRGSDFHRANLQGAYLSDANLLDAYLSGANLQEASLYRADLKGAGLLESNLRQARLDRANLQGAGLVWADLRGAHLMDANLQEARLDWASLRDAYLSGANLQKANLVGADLQGAFLSSVNLQGAFLGSADLQGAFLGKANLQDAVALTQEQIDSAVCDEGTTLPPGLTIKQAGPDETTSS